MYYKIDNLLKAVSLKQHHWAQKPCILTKSHSSHNKPEKVVANCYQWWHIKVKDKEKTMI